METEMMTSLKLGSKAFNISSLVSVMVQSLRKKFVHVSVKVLNKLILTCYHYDTKLVRKRHQEIK